jgi:hypothetical protein
MPILQQSPARCNVSAPVSPGHPFRVRATGGTAPRPKATVLPVPADADVGLSLAEADAALLRQFPHLRRPAEGMAAR